MLAWATSASAQVALEGTRVIYPAEKAAVAVLLRNGDERPALVQAWVADGDASQTPEASTAPFALTPPLLRLDPGQSKHIQVRAIGQRAPSDGVEHLYWLNVVDVPPVSKDGAGENQLQIAVRSRYKVLFRPRGVAAPGRDFPRLMDFELAGSPEAPSLRIRNRSPNYLNLGHLALVHGDTRMALANAYVKPHSERSIPLDAKDLVGLAHVDFSWIDDHGRLHAESRPVTVR